jgi:5-formyltetrahydrofolate cyclo-ligase
MSFSNAAIRPDKAALRFEALTRRDALSEAPRAEAAQAIAARSFPLPLRPGLVVSGYAPIRSEIDPTPLMQVLAAQGARLALPAIIGPDQPLQFRGWTPGDAMVRGQLGIMEPPPEAPQLMPDIVLVPLAAFDRAGHRVGYGAGHYDRSLEQLKAHKPVLAIGLAFAVQEIDAVPAAAHDARLDLVLTEREAIDFRSF